MAFLLYVNTIYADFAYDDRWVRMRLNHIVWFTNARWQVSFRDVLLLWVLYNTAMTLTDKSTDDYVCRTGSNSELATYYSLADVNLETELHAQDIITCQWRTLNVHVLIPP